MYGWIATFAPADYQRAFDDFIFVCGAEYKKKVHIQILRSVGV